MSGKEQASEKPGPAGIQQLDPEDDPPHKPGNGRAGQMSSEAKNSRDKKLARQVHQRIEELFSDMGFSSPEAMGEAESSSAPAERKPDPTISEAPPIILEPEPVEAVPITAEMEPPSIEALVAIAEPEPAVIEAMPELEAPAPEPVISEPPLTIIEPEPAPAEAPPELEVRQLEPFEAPRTLLEPESAAAETPPIPAEIESPSVEALLAIAEPEPAEAQPEIDTIAPEPFGLPPKISGSERATFVTPSSIATPEEIPLEPEPVSLGIFQTYDQGIKTTEIAELEGQTPEELLQPATTALTPIAWESLRLGKPLAENAGPDHPAMLAYARSLRQAEGSEQGSAGKTGEEMGPSLLLEFIDENPQRRWSEDEIVLIEQVTNQLSLALENAQLFQQTQQARDALQISVRYQKSVAQAVTELTERGSPAIAEVLQFLGEAAQASRAYYFETQRDPLGLYWRLVSEWCAPGVASLMANPALSRLTAAWLPGWIEQLSKAGYIAQNTGELSPEEKDFWELLGGRSLLQVPVTGQHGAPGCIGFSLMEFEREWSGEEIAALRTAANALANTLVRENLFSQLQTNLSETEAQYQASAQINSVNSFEEILAVLRQFTILGYPQASQVFINHFDQPWSNERRPTWLIPAATWEAKGSEGEIHERAPLSKWKSAETLFIAERPTVVSDIASDPRIKTTDRSEYLDSMGAKSLVHVPLNVSGRWIGQIIALYSQVTEFSESEVRRLIALSSQAAVALESLRLLEETRQRNEELLAINQITGAVSRTLELDQVLEEILQRVLAITGFECGLISSIDPVTKKLRLSVHQNLPDQFVNWMNQNGMDGTPYDVVFRTGQAVHVPDLLEPPEELEKLAPLLPEYWPHAGVLASFGGTKAMGFRSYLGVPLNSKGTSLGTVCLLSRRAISASQGRIELMKAIGQQVGIAIENAQLFQGTQQALGETEALYQASSELNGVQTYDDVLRTLQKFTILGKADQLLSISLFSRPTSGKTESGAIKEISSANMLDMPDWVIPIAQSSALPGESLPPRYLAKDYPVTRLLSPAAPTIIERVEADARLDDQARLYFSQNLQANSLLLSPLYVGGLWIGFILGAYSAAQKFEEAEIRRLSALSSQAAIAVQNLSSIELAEQRTREAQRRSQELTLINNTVSNVAASLDLQRSLDIVTGDLANALNAFASIALLQPDKRVLTVVSNANAGLEIPSTVGIELEVRNNPVYQRVIETRSPLVIDRLEKKPPTGPLHDALVRTGAKQLLVIPLVASKEAIGTVELSIHSPGRSFTRDEIRLAESIVLQAATALQNAQLFEQTQHVLEETEALYRASANFQAARDYDEVLETLRAHTVLGKAPRCVSIVIYERSSTFSHASLTTGNLSKRKPLACWEAPEETGSESHIPADMSLPMVDSLLTSRTVACIENTLEDALLDEKGRAVWTEIYQIQSAVFAPLIAGAHLIGHVGAFYPQPSHFSDQEIRRLTALAGQAAVAIQNQRLLAESRRRASQLQTAAEIARDTSSTLALDNLLQRSVQLITQRFGYYHASIFLIDEGGKDALVRESTGLAGEEMKRSGHSLRVGGRSVIGQVTASGQPLVLNDVLSEQARGIHKPNPLLPLTCAELGIPLKIGEKVIGALDVQSEKTSAFSEDDISVLQILSDQIAVAVDNARSYELVQKAMEGVREADRLKSQFLANMSHELRTPLNSIIGFSRVILKGIDGPVTEQQSQDLIAIYNSGQHLLGLINDVLDLSKIEAGKMELAFEDNVNLADLIHSVLATTQGLVKDKPIELKQVIDPALPLVTIDPMKIRQVLINLLSNAAKFTEEGSIKIEASEYFKNSGDEQQVIVKVIDTGPGISSADKDKLFQPFSQVDGSLTRKSGGTGLGLSISSHLVRLHHGMIGVDSKKGAGSTFYFILPVNQPVSDEEQEPDLPDPEVPTILAASFDEQPLVQAPAPHPAGKIFPFKTEPAPGENVIYLPSSSENTTPPPFVDQPATRGEATIGKTPGAGAGAKTPADKPAAKPQLILAVDGDHEVVDLYRRYLADKDYSIISLTNLEQVLAVARGIQPFVITLDVAMSEEDHRRDTPQKALGTGGLRLRLPGTGGFGTGILKLRGFKTGGFNPEHPPASNPKKPEASAEGENSAPPLDGWTILGALKSDPYTRHIPVIVCSVLEEQERAMRLGASDYLLKPILEEDLVSALERLAP